MAKNTTGNGTTIDGVTVVHPDNMGSDFKWNPSTNKYEVAISARPGNLLNKRADGLYYGIEAPPDTSNLYVDAENGDDSNKGTKASPLRTVEAAMKRKTFATLSTIHLREGQTHVWNASSIGSSFARAGYATNFRPYGEKFDEAVLHNIPGSMEYTRVTHYPKPVLKFIPDRNITGDTGKGVIFINTLNPLNTVQTHIGIIFDLTATSDTGLAANHKWVFGYLDNMVNSFYAGCEFRLGSQMFLHHVGQPGKLVFDQCRIDNTHGNNFIDIGGGAQLGIDIRMNRNLDAVSGLTGQVYTRKVDATPTTEYHKFIKGISPVGTNVITSQNLGG